MCLLSAKWRKRRLLSRESANNRRPVTSVVWFLRQLAGCTVLVIGAWLLLEPSKGDILNLFVPNVKPHETINLIAYSLLGLGFTVLTVGFFGCRAALRGNQCIIATVSKTTLLSPPVFRYRPPVKVGDVFVTVVPQYMSMLAALIVTELVTAAIGGLMTFQILSDLEGRLTSKLEVDYGHDPTSDLPFSQSLDFAQYKVSCSSTVVRCPRRLSRENVRWTSPHFFSHVDPCPFTTFWILFEDSWTLAAEVLLDYVGSEESCAGNSCQIR